MLFSFCAFVFSALFVAGNIVSDPADPLFRELAVPAEFDESEYGAGPLLEPGQTFHATPGGDGNADGLSWESSVPLPIALRRAGPGDTVLIGEGLYSDTLRIPGGEPGRPVRVFAAPGQRVIFNPSRRVGPFRLSPGYEHLHEIEMEKPANIDNYTAVWEADSRRVLEVAGSPEAVAEFPGTHYFDTENDRLYVRFHETDIPGERHVYILDQLSSINMGDQSYIHVRGIWFQHAPVYGMRVRGHNHTVEDCVFFANWGQGLYLAGSRCLIKNNYGFGNEDRGTIRLTGRETTDNLIIGNLAGPSPHTGRSRRTLQRHAINNYGHGGRRVHIVNNIMDDARSFRFKFAIPDSILQGNVLTGRFSLEGGWGEGGIVLRANTVLGGPMYWQPGSKGWNENWYHPAVSSFNNFFMHGTGIQPRFADPAYLDYRLQSDSPLRGAALNGADLGAYPQGDYRIYYVKPDGSDSASGRSLHDAFATLAHAAALLAPGDTLYVAGDRYGEALRIEASGAGDSPIAVRAHGRRPVELPGVELAGDWITLEGFDVVAAPADGIRVLGEGVILMNCLVRGAGGAAVYVNAPDFTLNHATLVESATGLHLDAGAQNARVRNSIMAFNRETPRRISAEALASYRGYNTCYHGPGADSGSIAETDTDSIVADPGFVDAAAGDYRIKGSSPAVYLGEFAPPAGARGEVVRAKVRITDVEVRNIQDKQVSVFWRTSRDDSEGHVQYRERGATGWPESSPPLHPMEPWRARQYNRTELGTRHAVVLTGLEPETGYEMRVIADGRLASSDASEVFEFRTANVAREPRTFHISPEGSDENDGLTPETKWRTIQRANNEVIPGDTVLIRSGTYSDTIRPLSSGLPGKRITYRAHGDGDVVIDSGQRNVLLVDLSDRRHITIEGLTLVSHISTGYPQGAVNINASSDIEILSNRILNPSRRQRASGISGSSIAGARIEGNVLNGQRYGLSLGNSDDVIVKNNTFGSMSVYTIVAFNCERFEFSGNLLYENRVFRNSFYFLWGLSEVEMDHNLYHSTDPRLGLGRFRDTGEAADDLAAWRELTGWDQNSIEADPEFVDFDNDDYRLKPGSPALGKGPGGRNIGAY